MVLLMLSTFYKKDWRITVARHEINRREEHRLRFMQIEYDRGNNIFTNNNNGSFYLLYDE
jgi:hypothetical protein